MKNRSHNFTSILLFMTLIVASAIGCATQTAPSDRLLWDGIDDQATNAPAAPK